MRMRHKPSLIRIVHGDEKAKKTLKKEFMLKLNETKVIIA